MKLLMFLEKLHTFSRRERSFVHCTKLCYGQDFTITDTKF